MELDDPREYIYGRLLLSYRLDLRDVVPLLRIPAKMKRIAQIL
jgi:hypothetical protein